MAGGLSAFSRRCEIPADRLVTHRHKVRTSVTAEDMGLGEPRDTRVAGDLSPRLDLPDLRGLRAVRGTWTTACEQPASRKNTS